MEWSLPMKKIYIIITMVMDSKLRGYIIKGTEFLMVKAED